MSESPRERQERIVIGAQYVLGNDGFRHLLEEYFGGKIPAMDTGVWSQFVMATHLAPVTNRLKPFQPYPRFPTALETADHFLPYDVQSARSPSPFWIGFWSESEAPTPYREDGNRQAWENGRELARTKHAEIYRRYVAKCQEAERAA